MALHFFRVLVSDGVQEQEALNQFLAQNHVVDIEKEFVSDGLKSHWAVCVTVARTSVSSINNNPASQKSSDRKRSSIDYKEVLSPSDFEVYAALRELRKQVAKDEGVPAYVIFTNAQLASMVTEKVSSKQALASINGIGEARVDKHAETFVSCLQEQLEAQAEAPKS
jgi:superfamily II DNA helicase RecQ